VRFNFVCSAFCRWSALPLRWFVGGLRLPPPLPWVGLGGSGPWGRFWVLAGLLLSALCTLSLVISLPSREGPLPPPVLVGRACVFPRTLLAYSTLLVIHAVGPSARFSVEGVEFVHRVDCVKKNKQKVARAQKAKNSHVDQPTPNQPTQAGEPPHHLGASQKKPPPPRPKTKNPTKWP